jgi:hypothetical protein
MIFGPMPFWPNAFLSLFQQTTDAFKVNIPQQQ